MFFDAASSRRIAANTVRQERAPRNKPVGRRRSVTPKGASSSRSWLDYRGAAVRIDGSGVNQAVIVQDSTARMLRFATTRGDSSSFGITHDHTEQTVDDGNFTVTQAGCYLFSMTARIEKNSTSWPVASGSVTTSTDSAHNHTVTVPVIPMNYGLVRLIFQYYNGSSWVGFPDVHQMVVTVRADSPVSTVYPDSLIFTHNLEVDDIFRISASMISAATNAEVSLTGCFLFVERLGDVATEA